MKQSIKIGLSFGLTSGIITTLGLIVGLHAGTHSKAVIIGGILTIAIADAFSDALGIHVSQESQEKLSNKEIWEATIATFLSKFLFALTFVLPTIMFNLSIAILISVFWGMFALGVFNYIIARKKKTNPKEMILEHLFIALVVIVITHYIGDYISTIFN